MENGESQNKYIQQKYLLGELKAEKERIQETKRRLEVKNKEGGVDVKALETINQEEKDVDEAIARYGTNRCEVCGNDTVHITAINYETWGIAEGTNEPIQSKCNCAKYCPECGRKL